MTDDRPKREKFALDPLEVRRFQIARIADALRADHRFSERQKRAYVAWLMHAGTRAIPITDAIWLMVDTLLDDERSFVSLDEIKYKRRRSATLRLCLRFYAVAVCVGYVFEFSRTKYERAGKQGAKRPLPDYCVFNLQ